MFLNFFILKYKYFQLILSKSVGLTIRGVSLFQCFSCFCNKKGNELNLNVLKQLL